MEENYNKLRSTDALYREALVLIAQSKEDLAVGIRRNTLSIEEINRRRAIEGLESI